MVVTSVPQDKNVALRLVARSTLSILRNHPIFCDLDPDALDQLCRYAKHTSLKRGAPIFSKGDAGKLELPVLPIEGGTAYRLDRYGTNTVMA